MVFRNITKIQSCSFVNNTLVSGYINYKADLYGGINMSSFRVYYSMVPRYNGAPVVGKWMVARVGIHQCN